MTTTFFDGVPSSIKYTSPVIANLIAGFNLFQNEQCHREIVLDPLKNAGILPEKLPWAIVFASLNDLGFNAQAFIISNKHYRV